MYYAVVVYYTHNIISESCKIKPNLGCYKTFQIDFAPNRIPFSAKSIGKENVITIQIWFYLARYRNSFSVLRILNYNGIKSI